MHYRVATQYLLVQLAPVLTVVLGATTLVAQQYEPPSLIFDKPAIDEPEFDYGPGACEPRRTLFQWSYGTSFSGGSGFDVPLSSDRPDFTESSKTVGRGVSQLEFGYTYINDNNGGDATRIQSIGEPLLRVGVGFEWLEMRIATNYIKADSFNGGAKTTVDGFADLDLGVKIALTPQEGILPEMALIPHVVVPTGDLGITDGGSLPGVIWIYSWELSDRLSLGGSSALQRAPDEDTGLYHSDYIQSMVVGTSLSECVGCFFEWFAFMPIDALSAATQHYFDGGFTYSVTDNLQLDIRGGVGLNSAAEDHFIGSGAVIRF